MLADPAPNSLQTPTQKRLAEQLRVYLNTEKLSDGMLPPERTIALKLGVSRPTLRIVLDAMEGEGFIRKLGSAGRQMCPVAPVSRPLLSDTYAIISSIPGQPADDARSSGWEIYIQGGASQAIQAGHHNALTLTTPRVDITRMRSLLEGGLSGVVVCHYAMPEKFLLDLVAMCSTRHVPIVLYGSGSVYPNLDTVYSDHSAGASALTTFLHQRGCKRIVRAWPAGSRYETGGWLSQRDAGFESTAKSLGLDLLPPLYLNLGIGSDVSELEKTIALRTLAGYLVEYQTRHGKFDALMAASDGEADMLMAALPLLGLEPGKDVHVVGYDNYFAVHPFKITHFVPAATVDKLNPKIGRELVRLLFERAAGELPSEPQHRLVLPRLVDTKLV